MRWQHVNVVLTQWVDDDCFAPVNQVSSNLKDLGNKIIKIIQTLLKINFAFHNNNSFYFPNVVCADEPFYCSPLDGSKATYPRFTWFKMKIVSTLILIINLGCALCLGLYIYTYRLIFFTIILCLNIALLWWSRHYGRAPEARPGPHPAQAAAGFSQLSRFWWAGPSPASSPEGADSTVSSHSPIAAACDKVWNITQPE